MKPENTGKPMYAVGVSVLLTNKKGQILLAKRKNNSGAGLLSTPGGRIEYDEKVLDAAVREVKEEANVTLRPGHYRLIGWRKFNRFGNHYFMFYVHAISWNGRIKNLIPDKSENWRWFDLASVDANNCTEPDSIMRIVWHATATDRTIYRKRRL